MKKINIKLENFEGPFELLLNLINKNKMDIYDIPIAKLTDDYIECIEQMKYTDIDEISNFILIATTLLEIKSKVLLPKEKKENILENNDDEITKDELINKLIEYKKFKTIAENFKNIGCNFNKILFKEKENIDFKENESEINLDEILNNINLNTLYNIFEDVLKRADEKKDVVRSDFKSVQKPIFNINNKISYIKDLVFLNNKISFNKIFEESTCKAELVVTFLAVLELIKLKYITVYQENIFSEIIITKGELI